MVRFAGVAFLGVLAIYAPAVAEGPPNVDRFGDALPAGALMRLGTTRLRNHEGVNSVAFSPNGKMLASGGGDSAIRLWEVPSGRLIAAFRSDRDVAGGGPFRWNAVGFSPDGAQLAAVNEQGAICLWSVADQKLLWREATAPAAPPGVFRGGHSITCLAFSADGTMLATTGETAKIQIWDVGRGVSLGAIDFGDQNYASRPVVFSPDNRLIASADKTSIGVWDVKTLQPVFKPKQAHQQDVATLVFTNDSRRLISGGGRIERVGDQNAQMASEIFVWDAQTGERQEGFESPDLEGSPEVVLSADGARLYSAHHDRIVLWDVASRVPERFLRVERAQFGGRPLGMAISPDQKWLATRGPFNRMNRVGLWDLIERKELSSEGEGHCRSVLAVCYSPDGSQIATGGADGAVRVWDAATGEHLQLVDEGSGWVRFVAFAPDGKRLYLGRETNKPGEMQFRGEIKVIRAGDGKLLAHWPTPDRVMCGDVSADGRFVAAAIGLGDGGDPFGDPGVEGPEDKLLVWDVQSGEQVAEFPRGGDEPRKLSFTEKPDEVWLTKRSGGSQRWNWRTKETLDVPEKLQPRAGIRFAETVLDVERRRLAMAAFLYGQDRSKQGLIVMQNLGDGTTLWEQSSTEACPRLLAVSPNGQFLAVYMDAFAPLNAGTSHATDSLDVYHATDGEKVASYPLAEGSIRSMTFSPDGSHIVTGMELGDALVWKAPPAR